MLKAFLMKTCFWFKLVCDTQMVRPITCHVSSESCFCVNKPLSYEGFLRGFNFNSRQRLSSGVRTFLESHISAAAAGIGSSSLIGGGVWKTDSGL